MPLDLGWLSWMAAVLAGGVGLWLGRHLGRRAQKSESAVWEQRWIAQAAEGQILGRRVSRLTDDLKQLSSRLGSSEAGLAAAQAALDSRTAELGRARDAERRLASELDDSNARNGSLGDRLGAVDRQRATLVSEAFRLTVRIEALEAELRAAAELGRKERREHQQALAAAERAVEQRRREADDLASQLASLRHGVEQLAQDRDEAAAESARAGAALAEVESRCRQLTLELAEVRARSATVIGALEARADRVDPVLRQLEDREALLQAVLFERDEAQRALVDGDRNQSARIRELEAELRRAERAMAEADERIRDLEPVESRLGAITRDRDEARAAVQRSRLEIETLRAELRERDRRFRALAAGNEELVQALRYRVGELESEAVPLGAGGQRANGGARAANGDGADDLTQIYGIGPVLARRLSENGVTSFRQIATWSDEDVDRMAKVIGAFPDRIRRDAWIWGARDAYQRKYGFDP